MPDVRLFHPENLRLTPDNVCCLSFFAGGGFGPGLLEADIDGGMDDAGLRDLGAGEEHEFGFVKDALGRQFRFVSHWVGSIDQI